MVIAFVLAYPGLTGFANPIMARWILFFGWLLGTIAIGVCGPVSLMPLGRRTVVSTLASLFLASALYALDSKLTEYREEAALPLTFKPSAQFTSGRRATIRHSLLDFKEYLKSIDFPIYKQTPYIAISSLRDGSATKGAVPYLVYGSGPEYRNVLLIKPEDANNPPELVRLYAIYEVNMALSARTPNAFGAVMFFGNSLSRYFWSSYYGSWQRYAYNDPWADAFWNKRSAFGKGFTGKVAAYSIRIFQDRPLLGPDHNGIRNGVIELNSPVVNDEIYSRVLDAFQIEDDGTRVSRMKSIIKNNNIALSERK